jgi:metal-responsive CopG/Arc/MetJ family transcriptional regulator
MGKDEILHMRVEKAILEKLDEIRRHDPDIPNRSKMVRMLIERAYEELSGKVVTLARRRK